MATQTSGIIVDQFGNEHAYQGMDQYHLMANLLVGYSHTFTDEVHTQCFGDSGSDELPIKYIDEDSIITVSYEYTSSVTHT